jgi:hypothetical protein
LGHSPDALIATLSQALFREDAGFHAYQMLEAGVRQFDEWGNCDQVQHILIAVARYLAAHFPTQRALLQTADIATRLTRGGELHREAQGGRDEPAVKDSTEGLMPSLVIEPARHRAAHSSSRAGLTAPASEGLCRLNCNITASGACSSRSWPPAHRCGP